MGRNVWVFGDSYAGDIERSRDIPTYYNLLGDHFGAGMVNSGHPGSSLAYTYIKFNELRHQFKENDIVIICLTDIHRQHFFDNKPQLSSIHKGFLNNVDESVIDAMEKFFKYLHNPSCDFNNLINFLYNVHTISENLSLTTFCLSMNDNRLGGGYGYMDPSRIPNHKFPSIIFPKGFLHDINSVETSDKNVVPYLRARIPGYFDCRINHMCMSNHRILAEKLIHTINTGEILRLNEGFIRNILTIESLNSEEFRNKELRPGTRIEDLPESIRL